MIRGIAKRIRANILVGFFLTVPIVATILISNFLFDLATGWLPPTIMPEMRSTWSGQLLLQIITLIAVLTAFGLVGLLTRNILGRHLLRFSDTLLARIPVIKGIYVSVRQISESLFTQRKTLFKEVVMIQYPRKGLHSLAFVTARVPDSMASDITKGEEGSECVSVFIPTTPNPTSGVLILLPRSETMAIDMDVGEALTFVMSAGAVSPGEKGAPAPTLLDKLEAWLRQSEEPTHATEHIDEGSLKDGDRTES
ncbi:MAG: DUF502 domain-containing protein [Kiritimatiellia bacterium]|jgi:uncharacterized membrane protein|nr:DUF502 domain-containing protein [Kiritimatiellia bacterium]MDP6631396.1 DUF502 domain-containing protein [Kiritimatiellia bacterium]MDP6809131.1 DUF502 domain-containing protein [Kiritimatiellia bacterium]MDP7023177.1 DUF502 domain-containing protein [Kiritimatiellia bacterium]